ncbi:MAG: hypothetical protein ACFFD1_01345 [Candidatus Thorarchaeota archaeon]
MSSSKGKNRILVGSQILEEEKCGNCKNKMILKTYLDLTNRKRILFVGCETCNSFTPIKELAEQDKFSIKKPEKQRGWSYK